MFYVLWAHGKMEHHDRKMWRDRAVHLMADGRREGGREGEEREGEKEEGSGKRPSPEDWLPGTHFI